jgi:hypothetical protein
MEPSKRLRFDWVWGILFRPRKTISQIVSQPGSSWLTPLLVLTLTGLLLVAVNGWVQGLTAAAPELPVDFEYYTPEQQTQWTQALQMRQGPVFRYVFPALTSLLGVWVGWLLVGGLLHLALTLLGGRGDATNAMNLVAWASLPYAVRDLVRIGYLAVTHQVIQTPGLSGFVDTANGGASLFLAALLELVDIYLIWKLLLLCLGVKAAGGLSTAKAFFSSAVVLLLVLLLQAGLGYLGSALGSLSIVRMFF